jgi:glycosyltransferase involved in cell wall biosynthesis
MRLLLDYRPALKQPTGVGSWVHELVRALLGLATSGDPDARDLEIVLFSSSWRDRLADSAARELAGATPADCRLPVRVLNLAWYRLGWPPVEWLANGPFDIVHSTNPVLLPARSGIRISTIYDLDFLHHPERAWGEMRRDFPALTAVHARRADLVVTISNHTARQIGLELGVPDDRIVVCRPGVPPWITAPAAAQAPQSGGYLLFVGTLEPRKNIHGLLDGYERLLSRWPDAPRLVVAGRHGSAAQPWIERAAGPVFKGRVEIRGYISDADRASIYRGAAAVVLPSFEEGFGLPALEAMALGIPVVVSNRGALPEVVGPAGLHVDPEDAVGLADALFRVLTVPALREACRNAGLARARDFNWTDSALGLLQRYVAAVRRSSHRVGQ